MIDFITVTIESKPSVNMPDLVFHIETDNYDVAERVAKELVLAHKDYKKHHFYSKLIMSRGVLHGVKND